MHDKINVCLLNDSFPPVIDGVANAVVNYGEIISTKNLGKATVVTPEYPGAVDGYPFDVVRYPSLSTEQLVGYRAGVPFDAKIFGKLEKAGFNIIHTHCPVVSTLMARTLREKLDIPVVFTYHTKFDVNICDMVRSKLIQEAALHNLCANIQSCDEVWVVSRGAGENLRGIGYEGEYIVMENGVDFPKGRVAPEEAMEIRRQYGIGPDERVFMYVGRMMWYKGIRITLDGLKKAKEEGFAFKMIFVGDGADRSEMEKYAKELGLEKECIFPGTIRDRELLRRYKRHSCPGSCRMWATERIGKGQLRSGGHHTSAKCLSHRGKRRFDGGGGKVCLPRGRGCKKHGRRRNGGAVYLMGRERAAGR